jgi:hypothetical protein
MAKAARSTAGRFAFDVFDVAQDDWRAMREAALKEQAAGTDAVDTPMVDEDVKPCVGELQVAPPELATRTHPLRLLDLTPLISFDRKP